MSVESRPVAETLPNILIILGLIVIFTGSYIVFSYPSWATEMVQPEYDTSTPSSISEAWRQWQENMQRWQEAMAENARRTQVLLEWQTQAWTVLLLNSFISGLACIIIGYLLKTPHGRTCPSCGSRLRYASKFCPYCGAKLED